ncbi:MAG: ATP-binding protein, partial [Lysobacteraceae bacterium]
TRHIRFTTERPPGPALCEADRGLLMRALVNLLGNAVKYGREHTTVDCAIRPAGPQDRQWLLSIRDHGPGMTAEQQSRLFTPFHRLSPQDRSRPGVGLGLVFVRTVVERHGGRIDVRSPAGQGTCFEITLAQASE